MKIQELRKRTGLSQSKFAEKYHISIRTLQRWERGQNATPDFVVFMIEQVLDLEEKVNGKHSD